MEPGEHVLAISLHNTAPPSTDLRLGGITLVETGTDALQGQDSEEGNRR